jgi:hypothetical protein
MEESLNYLTHNWLALTTSLLALVALIFILNSHNKRRRELNVSASTYVNQYVLKDHNWFLMLALVAINVSEAIFAATMPMADDVYINIVTRFISHMSIMFCSLIFMLDLPKSILDIIELRATYSRAAVLSAKNKMLLRLYYIRFFMNVVLSFGMPILILFIICIGLDKYQLAVWWMKDIFFDMRQVYWDHGLSAVKEVPGVGRVIEHFNVYEKIGVDFYVALSAMIAHIAIGFVDSVWATIEGLKGNFNQGNSAAERANNRGFSPLTPDEELNAASNVTGIVKALVGAYSNTRADDPTTVADAVYNIYADLTTSNPQAANDMALKLGQFYKDLKTLNDRLNAGLSRAEYNAAMSGQEARVRDYFRRAPIEYPLAR